jgi:uncharacterized MAPEG superfamily protein
MTLADVCIVGAVAAYILPIVVAKYSALNTFDNSRPRDPDFYKDPFRARGLGAHQNGMEGFAFFAAAVIVAQIRGAGQPVVDGLAIAYVVLRLAYVAAYLGDRAGVRSMVWILGLAVNLALFFSPLWAKA